MSEKLGEITETMDANPWEGRTMPRIDDSEARREQIVQAAAKLLSEGGFVNLTLRNLAKELGGSMRLVTHYFGDRQELITALLEQGLRDTDDVLLELSGIPDDAERLRHAVYWFLPLDPETLRLEKVRVALVVHQHTEPVIEDFFTSVDLAMRRVLDSALPASLAAEKRAMSVDLLRAWASGIALASVEHPEHWTPERQREVTDEFLRQVDLE